MRVFIILYIYSFFMQLKMALKSSGASQASRTAMSSGRQVLTARQPALRVCARCGSLRSGERVAWRRCGRSR